MDFILYVIIGCLGFILLFMVIFTIKFLLLSPHQQRLVLDLLQQATGILCEETTRLKRNFWLFWCDSWWVIHGSTETPPSQWTEEQWEKERQRKLPEEKRKRRELSKMRQKHRSDSRKNR